MNITIIQTHLHWQDKQANLAMFEQKIASITESTDLIVLPEMFNTGFTMEAQPHAEREEESPTLQKMQKWAKEKQAAICGSIIAEDNGSYYNRMYFVLPDGTYQMYNKRHLFRMANEDEHFTGGETSVIIEYKGWKIKPLICYDLRFPIWSRNNANEYDILLYVANWPAPRKTAWSTLLKARAIENLSYCVGVNRIGKDGSELEYSGNSAIIDFKGEVIFENENDEISYTAKLEKEKLEAFREKFPAHLDADLFEIK